MKRILRVVRFGISLLVLFSSPSWGANENKWSANLSASLEAGRLGNGDVNLQERTMTALSLQALPGYYISPSWLLGLSLNYRIQRQYTPLSESGDTNLAGRGLLVGLGAITTLSEHWTIQGALHFVGKYDFDEPDSGGSKGNLSSPLGVDIKAQYLWDPQSSWSVDGIVNFLSWKKISVNGTDEDHTSTQWMVGIGMTYRWGHQVVAEGGASEAL